MNEENRVKFTLNRIRNKYFLENYVFDEMSFALEKIQELGCLPVLSDGFLAGNIAMRWQDRLFVSRSGRSPGAITATDFVEVVYFNRMTWQATYYSADENIKPTSDTPLHWAALMEASTLFAWANTPNVSIHGHALETEKEAKQMNIPISPIETEFSTPTDRKALLDLMQKYPYPDYPIYVRRGHGFFLLANHFRNAINLTDTILRKNKVLCSNVASIETITYLLKK